MIPDPDKMIPYEDLLGFVNAPVNEHVNAEQVNAENPPVNEGAAQGNAANVRGNVDPNEAGFENQFQVGFVQVPEIRMDLEFFQSFQTPPPLKPSSKALRLWVQFFSSNNNSSSPIVMPDNWLAFSSSFLCRAPPFPVPKIFFSPKPGTSSVILLRVIPVPFSFPHPVLMLNFIHILYSTYKFNHY